MTSGAGTIEAVAARHDVIRVTMASNHNCKPCQQDLATAIASTFRNKPIIRRVNSVSDKRKEEKPFVADHATNLF